MHKPMNVAMVGLGFGAEFIPIYQALPDVQVYAICQRSKSKLDQIGDQFGIAQRFTEFQDVLKDPLVDFVHINSPIPDHAWMSIEALKDRQARHLYRPNGNEHRGLPSDLRIGEANRIEIHDGGNGRVQSRVLVHQRRYSRGDLGEIQHLAASHPQDMDGWPDYWQKMIPMHYATHVVSPCLGLLNGRAEYVSCFGSGVVRDSIAHQSGNKFALESCHIKIKDSDVTAHVWRCLYDVARQYRESFDVYGTKRSFEWTLVEHEPHVIHTAKKPEPEIAEKIKVPDYAHLLPESIRKFTLPSEIHDTEHLSFVQGGGHGGSHPHLVNEFVSALRDDRDPWPNATTSANWTCVGICAHESALKGGAIVKLPEFTLS